MDKITRIKELVKIINEHNYNYYTLDKPTIADREYDKLYDELVSLEKETGLLLPTSPTNKVGGEVLKGFQKHQHAKKLYSLDKCNTFSELETWVNGIEKEFGEQLYSLEYKFDGLQMTLIYNKGKLVTAATRGNGLVGEDVTEQVKTIKTLPKTIPFQHNLIVQGETMMRLSVLEEYNKNNIEPLKNARNAAAGAIRNLDPKITQNRNLDLFIYGVVDIENKNFKTYEELIEFLKENGFSVYPYLKFYKTAKELENEIKNIDNSKKSLDILIDGAVIKINNMALREEIGYTSKFPKWAIAYKFEAQELSTTLNNVIWQVGRTGKLTPIAEIEPVELAGATIKRATLNNFGDILRKDVKINSNVFVRRSNEVIPEILGVAKHNPNSIDIKKPTHCPVCETEVVEVGANLFCPNTKNCPAQIEDKLKHFTSRNAMNIEGVSDKTIEAMRNYLNVNSVADLYKLTKDDLLTLEKFKDKKSINLTNSIEKSKNCNFANFIFALGINGVGEKTAKDLAKKFNNLTDLLTATFEDLISIKDIGDVVANNILNFFKDEHQINLINELLNLGVKIAYNKQEQIYNENFTNKNIVLTGELEHYSRGELTKMLEGFGAHVVSSVSKNTNLVIVGENPGSKFAKAKNLKIKIADENQLLKMLNEK